MSDGCRLSLALPTRIFWGLNDPALGEEMVDPSLELCDRGSVERFPELSHWLLHEEPETMGERLVRFFEGSGGG